LSNDNEFMAEKFSYNSSVYYGLNSLI
jgi:hypothetical protein